MKDDLTILWTTGEAITAEKMVLMYALNSKLNGWWDNVTLVIWGASARLISENVSVHEKLQNCMDAGVKVEACKACAEQLCVTEQLVKLGVDVKYYGEPLTKILKSSGHLITI